VLTATTRRYTLNGVRKLLRGMLENDQAEHLRLDRAFVTACPHGGDVPRKPRSAFPDHVARALADETNLRRLAEDHDPQDHGVRDMWVALVFTGRRCTEVLDLRLDCVGRLGGLPMLWHDQTKVGNYNDAIRIPESLYNLVRERQRKTLDRFEARHGRPATSQERIGMALFPTPLCNLDGRNAISYNWFQVRFRDWVDHLDLGGHFVAHQARHTLATNLLRQGATLTHVRRYLGHCSDRMAEHYVHLSHSDLEDVLHHVWVAGPGSARPGEVLSEGITAMNRDQAMAMALDLSRRSTPAEGGFCTFQPVVQGGACPWNLDCHNCDKFVLSGADLLYWRRKREQWGSLAERAPDDATADYLHSAFAPTAQAIDGLEKALAGIGLLEDALALDIRKPQDYFHRIWNIAFRATDLVDAAHGEDSVNEGANEGDACA
jgi:integrase